MHATIQRLIEREEGLGKSESTLKTRRGCLGHYSRWLADRGLDPVDVTDTEVDEYLISVKAEGYAPNTVASYYQCLQVFYGWASGIGDVVDTDPMDGLERKTYTNGNSEKHAGDAISYVSADEKDDMCESVPSPKIRNELLLRLAFQTGLRAGEIRNIEITDIDRDERAIRNVYQPKTEEYRTVFYQPSLDFLLTQYLDHGHRAGFAKAPQSEYLFCTDQAEQISTTTINRVVKEAAEGAGLQEELYVDQNGDSRCRVTSHTMRHSYAVNALKCGVDIRSVQAQLGHASLDQTTQYLQVIDDDVREAHYRFDPEGPDEPGGPNGAGHHDDGGWNGGNGGFDG